MRPEPPESGESSASGEIAADAMPSPFVSEPASEDTWGAETPAFATEETQAPSFDTAEAQATTGPDGEANRDHDESAHHNHALEVVSELAILKMKTAFELPKALRVRSPVNCAGELIL